MAVKAVGAPVTFQTADKVCASIQDLVLKYRKHQLTISVLRLPVAIRLVYSRPCHPFSLRAKKGCLRVLASLESGCGQTSVALLLGCMPSSL